jgi:hypothetical protein
MPYEIIHLPTATQVHCCLDSLKPKQILNLKLPVLVFELTEPVSTQYYLPVITKTKKEAREVIQELIYVIKHKRALYKSKPEEYSCCLRSRFYHINKIK